MGRKGIIWSLFLVMSISSCTLAPSKKFIRKGPSYGDVMPRVGNIGVVVDPCISKETVSAGTSFSVEDSKRAGLFMADAAKKISGGERLPTRPPLFSIRVFSDGVR